MGIYLSFPLVRREQPRVCSLALRREWGCKAHEKSMGVVRSARQRRGHGPVYFSCRRAGGKALSKSVPDVRINLATHQYS